LTDAVSFVVIQQLDISEALAFDSYFVTVGFVALLMT